MHVFDCCTDKRYVQLYGPLNMLGTIYRSINQTLVDTEKLLKLLSEPTDVNDKPNAPDLIVTDGEIEFRKHASAVWTEERE